MVDEEILSVINAAADAALANSGLTQDDYGTWANQREPVPVHEDYSVNQVYGLVDEAWGNDKYELNHTSEPIGELLPAHQDEELSQRESLSDLLSDCNIAAENQSGIEPSRDMEAR